jgi:hypothetical protein
MIMMIWIVIFVEYLGYIGESNIMSDKIFSMHSP